MSCGVGCKRSLDLVLLWLWHRLAATASIRPLAWEPLYAAGAPQTDKRQKKCMRHFRISLSVDFELYEKKGCGNLNLL